MTANTGSVASAMAIAHDIASSYQTPLPCPEPGCPRYFVRIFSHLEHIKTHSSEGQHVCPVLTCAKRFSTSGNLSRHKRLHGYIEPLQCPIQGCVCAFPSSRKLEKHMKFHFSAEVKPCSVSGCGKTFSTTGNLNRHLKKHHGLSGKKCPSPRHGVKSAVGVESPTSAEQWPHGICSAGLGDSDDLQLWSSTSFTPVDIDMTTGCMFGSVDDDVWTPELLDTLANLLDDNAGSGDADPVVDMQA